MTSRRDFGFILGSLSIAALTLDAQAIVTKFKGDTGIVARVDSPTISLIGNFDELEAQLAELRSLLLEAGDVPQGILEQLGGLSERVVLVGEIELVPCPSADRADELVIAVRFKAGGEYDRARSALRTLVIEGHG